MTNPENAGRETRFARDYARTELPKRAAQVEQFVDWIQPQSSDCALDLASGPATIARVLATRVKQVSALDKLPTMLREARRLAPLPRNLCLASAEAERLPFRDGSFDVLTCAYVLANIHDLPAILGEAARVLKRPGRLAFMDVVAPEDASGCAHLNRLEAMRSDCYTRIRKQSECIDSFRKSGFSLERLELQAARQPLLDWLRLSPALTGSKVSEELRETVVELAARAGLRPQGRGWEIEFEYQTAWFLLQPDPPLSCKALGLS